jgi:hypothetical protein
MLTIHQKSLYLLVLNATMILRSIGSTLKNNKNERTLRQYKICLFQKLESLINLIEVNQFDENVLLNTIIELADQFSISIGQSQKAINVILKYHYYSTRLNNNEIKKKLHCPIDSKILQILGIKNLKLCAINLETYNNLQNRISEFSELRIDFDDNWDRQHLEEEGLL